MQNRVKRDPLAYYEEFMLQVRPASAAARLWPPPFPRREALTRAEAAPQLRHFRAELEVFKLNPAAESHEFAALLSFLSHVAGCYPKVRGAWSRGGAARRNAFPRCPRDGPKSSGARRRRRLHVARARKWAASRTKCSRCWTGSRT